MNQVVQNQSDRRTRINRFNVQGSRFKVESFDLEHGTLNIEPPLGTTAARWLVFNNLLSDKTSDIDCY